MALSSLRLNIDDVTGPGKVGEILIRPLSSSFNTSAWTSTKPARIPLKFRDETRAPSDPAYTPTYTTLDGTKYPQVTQGAYYEFTVVRVNNTKDGSVFTAQIPASASVDFDDLVPLVAPLPSPVDLVDGAVAAVVNGTLTGPALAAKIGTEVGSQSANASSPLRLALDPVLNAKVDTRGTGMQDLVSLLDSDTRDVNLLVIGDSTAAASDGWVAQSLTGIAARFPKFTVVQHNWADGSPGSYSVTTTVAGTGTHTLHIWNGAVAGTTWQYHFDSSRWPTMIAAVNPDAALVVLGHNDNPAAVETGNTMPQRAKAIVFLEFLRTIAPSAQIILGSQNPIDAYPNSSQYRAGMLRSLARARGYGFIDFCKAFLDDGRTLYGTLVTGSGNVHPTTAGYAVQAARLVQEFAVKSSGRVQAQLLPAFSQLGQNLVADPTFANYNGSAVPNGWSLTNATHSRDTTNFETAGGGVKLTKSAAGTASYASVSLPLALVKGKTVTAVARLRVPSTGNSNVGQTSLADNTNIVGSETWSQLSQFIWRAVVFTVSPTATSASARFYVDPTTGSTLYDVTLDRFGVFIGDVPFDPAPSQSLATTAAAPDVQIFTAGGTWSKPAGATRVDVIVVGSGAGGGAGARQVSGAACSGGAGGGGGAMSTRTFPAGVLGATELVQIGAIGTGAAGRTTDTTAGAAGANGSPSTFGTHLRASGGTGGAGGALAAGSTPGAGGAGVIGGGSGGGGTSGAAGGAPSGNTAGPNGGGGGGGISTTPAAFAGGTGSASGTAGLTSGTAGTSGGGAGGAGGSATATEPTPGSGGGGGGSSITGVGGAGGVGGSYGAGGGGGGSSLNGNTSGAGGDGAPGLCIVISS